jgi:hypothetical protein
MDNWQSKAYTRIALIRAGLNSDTIDRILGELHYCFDIYTEGEVEERARVEYNKLLDKEGK